MAHYKNISIENIYYMLSYAFTDLKQHCDIDVQAEKFDNIANLFAVILSKGISIQIKRGLHKNYVPQCESLHVIKGKFDFTKSIISNSFMQKKIVCHFDEFNENTLFNQIIKTTSIFLTKVNDVKSIYKKSLKKLLLNFSHVDEIDVTSIIWSTISYQRNNATYRTLINICYLIINGLLLTEKKGEHKLQSYLDDVRMCLLYEKFVRAYYQKHFPELKVSSTYIPWDCTQHIDSKVMLQENMDFLPTMKTDIVLSHKNKKNETCTLIIDTKFYSNTMQKPHDRETYRSQHLYQIFAYVKNKDTRNQGNVSGMLLYANTDKNNTPENDYHMSGNTISIRILDLNTSWEKIKEKLNLIAHTFIESSKAFYGV